MAENNKDPTVWNRELLKHSNRRIAGSGDNKTNEYAQIAGIISDLDRRLRVLEERYNNLRKRIQLTDQNVIESERAFGKELRSLMMKF
jgi:hypothetical protein